MVMNNDISIRKRSLDLKLKKGSKNQYELSFAFDALAPVEIVVYLLAEEKKEPTNNITIDITPRADSPKPTTFFFQSASNMVIERACEINFDINQKSSFENFKDNFYPLIIKFVRIKIKTNFLIFE